MRCARSLSPELEKIIEDLSPEHLDAVVAEACAYVRQEYSGDNEIRGVIEAVSFPLEVNAEIERRCEQLAARADDRYIQLELDDKDESALQFRRMCIFNGLRCLFSDNEMDRIVDEMVYDLAHGSASYDAYLEVLMERLRQHLQLQKRGDPNSASPTNKRVNESGESAGI